MLGVLWDILCVLQNIFLGILWAPLAIINLVIVGLAALVTTVVGLLPTMWAPLAWQGPPEAVGWIAWAYPMEQVLAFLGIGVAAYLAFLLVRVALNWAKAL